MNIKNCNFLNNEEIMEIETFIQSNIFNHGISFLDNDMNYYEDFPCFSMLYDNEELIAFMSIFIPDSASCEIYLHISDKIDHSASEIYNKMYTNIKPMLEEYQLYNQYLLFDRFTSMDIDRNINFSHSECLMEYSQKHSFNIENPKLQCIVENCDESITFNTYLDNILVGTCLVEVSNNYALIHDVEVKSAHRGFGYGTETLYHTVNYLKEKGYTQILLHVNSANTIAFTMYSHHGFNIIEQIDYYKII